MKNVYVALTGAVVVLGASWVGASWYTGKQIEVHSGRGVEQANHYFTEQYPALKLRVEAEYYHRGFFSSQARYFVSSGLLDEELNESDQPASTTDKRIYVDVDIEHGPFPAHALRQGEWRPAAAYTTAAVAQTDALEKVFELTGGKPPFTGHAQFRYNGDAALDWSVPAWAYKEQDGKALMFSGLTGNGDFVKETEGFIGNLRVDSIKVKGPGTATDEIFSIEGLTAGLSAQRGTFGIGVGQSHMHAERVEINAPDSNVMVALANVGYRLAVDESAKQINMELVYGTEALRLGAVDMGALRMVLKVRDLDGPALGELHRQYKALSTYFIVPGDDDQSKLAAAAVMGAGQQILAGNPTFAIEPFLWKNDKDEQRGALSVQIGTPSTEGSTRDRMLSAVRRVDGFVNLSRPMAIDQMTKLLVEFLEMTAEAARELAIEEIDDVINTVQDLGLATLEDDKVVSRLHFADGVVDLNGQKMPVNEFFDQLGLMSDSSTVYPEDEEAESNDSAVPDETEVEGAESVGEIDTAGEAGPDVAMAQQEASVLGGMDTIEMGKVLDSMGYTYTVGEDEVGDPMITVQLEDRPDVKVQIVYYSCENGACDDALLTARFGSTRKSSLKDINDFNRHNRWVRAYIDENNVSMLEMDIDGIGGITRVALSHQVMMFFDLLDSFEASLGEEPKQ